MSAIDNPEKPLATDGFLLRHRSFAPLFWCQLFSAFSDNLLKNALVFVILFKTVLTGSDALIALGVSSSLRPSSCCRGWAVSLRTNSTRPRSRATSNSSSSVRPHLRLPALH